jgi:hypothetical protein
MTHELTNGYLVRHWRGDFSLVRSFWVHGMLALLVPGVLSIPFVSPPVAWREQPGAVRVFAGLWVLFVVLRLVLQLWSNIGIWRSATQHVQRGRLGLWAHAAKLFVVAAAVLQIGGLVYIARSPYSVVFQIAFGRDPHGHTKIQVSPDGQTMFVSGNLGEGFAAELKRTLQHSVNVRTLKLSSHGGRMYEAIAAANAIRARKLATRVEDHCDSGCTLLFLAGRDRSVGVKASLGFHQPVLGELDGTDTDTEILLRAMKGSGIPERFLERIRTLSKHEAWYPSPDELFEYNVITTPVTGPYR